MAARSPTLTEVERSFVRLAALLHDIGHVAAGHTFEDELGLLAKHDSDERLNHVLDRSVWRGVDSGTSLRTLVDQLYGPDAELTGLDKSASEIFLDMVSKSRTDVKTQTAKFRLSVCRDIVGNTICADLLDYLHRDWWHIGKPRDFDSRLLDYLEIREADFPLLDSRIVVNLREKAEIRSDGVSAIFDLLETRYLLGEVALFHRKKLTASAMLERLIAEISDASNDDDWFEARLDELLECSDEEMIQMLLRLGEGLCDTGGLSEDRRTRLSGCLLLAHRLRYRQLYKKVLAFKSHELSSSMQFVQENLGGANGKSNRLNSCRALEEDFHLPQGSVVIYCPNRAPHAKIAKVQVLVNGRVEQVAVLDSEQADPIGLAVCLPRNYVVLKDCGGFKYRYLERGSSIA